MKGVLACVVKVFNNVVLARDHSGGEVVLTGRGLGFGAMPGEAVTMERVQRTFVPDAHQAAEQLAAFLVELPPEAIAVAEEILVLARSGWASRSLRG
ncbi:MAG: hypothetical protein IPL43_04170 [Micropruina sp.]|nr:hypothetical protein [Micropruina sp.]